MNPCADILAHLLSNNCPPGPLETGPLQAEVVHLKGKILALRNKLQEYEDLLQKHQTVLSAVRRIPLDVLGVVFSFAIPDCSNLQDWQELSNLSLVCKDWYRATHFAHQFTSRLTVWNHDLGDDRMILWLRRSGIPRRSLWVQQRNDPGAPCPLHQAGQGSECILRNTGLARFFAEKPKLDTLYLELPGASCVQHLLNAAARYGGHLRAEVLILELDRLERAAQKDQEYQPLPPCVKSLHLKIKKLVDTDFLHLPLRPGAFENLTFFSFSCAWQDEDPTRLITALAHCGNLERLKVDIAYQSWQCFESPRVVKLPKLRSLSVFCPNKDFKFLDFLDTPVLVNLEINARCFPRPDSFRGFFRRVLGSQDCLSVSVRLHDCDGSSMELIGFLAAVPNITHLTLEAHTLGQVFPDAPLRAGRQDLFQALTTDVTRPRTLIHLQTLELLGLPANYHFYYLKQYIDWRQRKWTPDRLATLVLDFAPAQVTLPATCTWSIAWNRDELRKAGVSVDIRYPKLDFGANALDIYK